MAAVDIVDFVVAALETPSGTDHVCRKCDQDLVATNTNIIAAAAAAVGLSSGSAHTQIEWELHFRHVTYRESDRMRGSRSSDGARDTARPDDGSCTVCTLLCYRASRERTWLRVSTWLSFLFISHSSETPIY